MTKRWFGLLILIGLAATFLEGSRPAWATNRAIKEFRISGQGYLRLAVPEGWKAEFQRPITEQAPTIIFSPPRGNAFKLVVTVQWDSASDFNTAAQINALLEKEWGEMAPSIKETRYEAHSIQGAAAQGFYFLATDKEPKPGDYEYLLRAGVGFGKLLLSATLVYQGKDAPLVADTLHLLRSASLVAN